MKLRSAIAVSLLSALALTTAMPMSASAAAITTDVNNIVHVLADGTLDVTTFDQGTGFTSADGIQGYVARAVTLADDTLLVVGRFDTYNGTPTPYGIAHVNPDGSIDQTFSDTVGSGVSGTAQSPKGVFVGSDGSIYVLGSFTSWSGTALGASTSVIRLNADGSRDTSFALGDFGAAVDGVQLSDGSLIIVGWQVMRKLNANGTVAVTCAAGETTSFAQSVELAGDTVWIARRGSTNTWDTTLSTCDSSTVVMKAYHSEYSTFDLAIDATGNAYMGGDFNFIFPSARGNVAKVNADGSLNTSFVVPDGGFNSRVLAIEFDGDGHLLLGGVFTRPALSERKFASLARVDLTTGAFDDSLFNSSGVFGSIWDITPDGSGGWYFVGSFPSFTGPSNAPPSITFNPNGGEGSMDVQTGTGVQAIAPCTFTMAGHTFTEWNTEEDGTGDAYADGADFDFSSAVTLYAQWQLDSAGGGAGNGAGTGAGSLAATGPASTLGFGLFGLGALILGAMLIGMRRTQRV